MSEDAGPRGDVSALLVGPPPPDVEDEHIAARAGTALFGTPAFEYAGRYRLLERIGRGGMGVVYAAYDTQLCRRIALKIVQNRVDPFTHRRAIHEALSLAKLAHVNVVAIYDAGTHEGRIWIAMEFVDGVTLREWAAQRPRRWSDTLPVLVDAARGLSAVHKAGLVHRDLKPDNIMLDGEGRVRVLDFGLAHGLRRAADVSAAAETTLSEPLFGPPTSVDGGTPAYMAPEQWSGEEVEAPADQYAWCMLAWELLVGERPPLPVAARLAGDAYRLPAWLRRVLRRGLQRDPGQRWPSMDALIASLERGARDARLRRNVLLTTGVLGLLASGFAVHRWQAETSAAACAVEGAAVERIWNPTTRARLRDALAGAGVTDAAERVVSLLDDHAATWTATRVEICGSTWVRENGEKQERARWCLDERAYEFEALVAELSHGDVRGAVFALPAVADISPLDPCRDTALLARLEVPPLDQREKVRAIWAELVQARALDGLGEYRAAAERMEEIEQAATHLGWQPLIATALLQRGRSLERIGRYDDARRELQAAFIRAMDVRMFETAVDAGVALVRLLGYRLVRTDEGRDWVGDTAHVLRSVEADEGLRAAALLRSESQLERAAGRLPEAELLLQRARAIQEQHLGPESPAVAQTLNDLGVVLLARGEHEEALVLHHEVLALRERLFGAEHPLTADSLNNLAIAHASLGEFVRAGELLERARSVEQDALADQHPDAAKTLKNLANLRILAPDDAGSNEEAQRLYEQAYRVEAGALGPEHPEVAATLHGLGNVHRLRGNLERAREYFEQALAIQERVFVTSHPDVATTLCSLASLRSAAGEHLVAVSLFEKALVIQERVYGAEHAALIRTLHELADAQRSLGGREAAQATLQRIQRIEVGLVATGAPRP